MKKIYIAPLSEVVNINIEKIMEGQLTDSIGEERYFDAKETSGDMFDQTDDLWEYDTKKDVWG